MTTLVQRTPTARQPRLARIGGVVLILAGILVGCRGGASSLSASKSGTPQYERANIVYDLDGSQRPLPLTNSEVKAVAFDADPEKPPPAPEWAEATLSIQYPHPDGTTDTARATLRLCAEPRHDSPSAVAQARRWLGWSGGSETADGSATKTPRRDDEIWVLDIPKQQLDLLLTDLQGNGFFQAQTRAESGTKLDVQLNWGRVQKEWSAEPRLDHFMARVYREGRLGGLVAKDTDTEHANIYVGR
ncbi:MAG: hypothetical protein JWN70_377 [Planctomycetaceae bacterium]|nr:hypothetical protein [Planctomycetaceae bacterium]